MKTHNAVFEEAFSFAALLRAYKRARRGKRYRSQVVSFTENLEGNLIQLQTEVLTETYRHGAYQQFIVKDAKKRHIQAAPFRDRVVHQAIHAALEPIYEPSFVHHSYACRRGKGTIAAITTFQRYVRTNQYVLAADISRYFASINHATLLMLLRRRLADQRMLRLCNLIIDSCHTCPGVGIPIGNLTSQLFANVYLNALDQYVKHTLGTKRYIRYMDDIAVCSNDLTELHSFQTATATFVEQHLQLQFHPKKVQIQPVRVGIDYLGYRVFPTHMSLRKSTVRRFVHRSRTADATSDVYRQGVIAWLQYARHAQSRGLQRWLVQRGYIPPLPMI